MYPLVPLRVARRVRLLVLRLKDAHHLSRSVPREVAPRAALRYHARMHVLLNGRPHALNHALKLPLRHGRAELGELGRDHGAYPVRGAEHGVVDLQPLLLLDGGPALPALELGGDLVSPSLEARVDGLDVYAGGGAAGPVALARARMVRGAGGVEGGVAEVIVVGVVAEAVGLRQALVAGFRGTGRHMGEPA